MRRASWRERSALVRMLRLWRTRSPRTFREKVRYKMLRDRRELVVTFADKAAVRTHVEAAGYGRLLPKAFLVTADVEELRRAELPGSYVVKPTHGSGAAIVVSPDAPPAARLPQHADDWSYCFVRPEHAPRDEVARIAREWLAQVYGRGPNHEWAYGRVPRQILVEEFLIGPGAGVPDDLKFFVFHGRCRFVEVDTGRFGRRTQDFFTPEWTHLDLSGGPPWADPCPPRPQALGELIAIAEALAADTDFVRVDLYDLDGRIVFGELTSFPAGGDSPFFPASFDHVFGAPWRVPRRYR